MTIFQRYAPFIQDFIYRNGWENLRSIQVAAGDAIFNTEENVLLSASTASGKTEAAFFPILTLLDEDPPSSVGAVYIGPLKALINDQFLRLNELCEEARIPVWHWHGDVSQSHKNKLIKHPSGILQITPESLEAMLMHRHGDITRLFGDLRFVVIDEVHSLMRGDRGAQTLCLVERLSRMAGVNPRRIGLSATIGDPEATGRFLAAGTGRGTVIPRLPEVKQKWRLSMEHFYITGPQAAEKENPQKPKKEETPVMKEALEIVKSAAAGLEDAEGVDAADGTDSAAGPDGAVGNTETERLPGEALDQATDTAPKAADPAFGYIFEHTRGKKCLVFSNSREEAEAVTTSLRHYCEVMHEPDRFLIHHGNLSASYRQTAEEEMKDDESLLTTVTTATLELGIDIGRLERAFQIDAPFTVSSFLQRMGRTGRRDLPPEMWFVMREDQPEARAMLPACVPWKLLQGIALIQLYLEERWVEPPRLDRLPYSLLYHQTMCTLASGGEMTPGELASRVLTLSVFRRVSKEDYQVLLRHMLQHDFIQRTERGGLIVGLAGERMTNSFKFYAVFQENEEYTVRSESQEIGTIVKPPPVGDKIAIAGHVWVVEEVDRLHHSVYCTLVKGNVPAFFGLCPGDINTKILERMKKVLEEEKQYPYLMKNASARLQSGRMEARLAGIVRSAECGASAGGSGAGLNADGGSPAVPDAALQGCPLVPLGGNMWVLFPWLGTYAFMALERLLKIHCAKALGLKGMDSSKPYFIQFTMKADRRTFFEVLTEAAAHPPEPMEFLYPDEVPVFEKYDDCVPDELVRKGFAYGVLDVEGMLARVKEWNVYL